MILTDNSRASNNRLKELLDIYNEIKDKSNKEILDEIRNIQSSLNNMKKTKKTERLRFRLSKKMRILQREFDFRVEVGAKRNAGLRNIQRS